MDAVHATGVVHRDVKPANLLLHADRDGAAPPAAHRLRHLGPGGQPPAHPRQPGDRFAGLHGADQLAGATRPSRRTCTPSGWSASRCSPVVRPPRTRAMPLTALVVAEPSLQPARDAPPARRQPRVDRAPTLLPPRLGRAAPVAPTPVRDARATGAGGRPRAAGGRTWPRRRGCGRATQPRTRRPTQRTQPTRPVTSPRPPTTPPPAIADRRGLAVLLLVVATTCLCSALHCWLLPGLHADLRFSTRLAGARLLSQPAVGRQGQRPGGGWRRWPRTPAPPRTPTSSDEGAGARSGSRTPRHRDLRRRRRLA